MKWLVNYNLLSMTLWMLLGCGYKRKGSKVYFFHDVLCFFLHLFHKFYVPFFFNFPLEK